VKTAKRKLPLCGLLQKYFWMKVLKMPFRGRHHAA
jgi:hypothetical protein